MRTYKTSTFNRLDETILKTKKYNKISKDLKTTSSDVLYKIGLKALPIHSLNEIIRSFISNKPIKGQTSKNLRELRGKYMGDISSLAKDIVEIEESGIVYLTNTNEIIRGFQGINECRYDLNDILKAVGFSYLTLISQIEARDKTSQTKQLNQDLLETYVFIRDVLDFIKEFKWDVEIDWNFISEHKKDN